VPPARKEASAFLHADVDGSAAIARVDALNAILRGNVTDKGLRPMNIAISLSHARRVTNRIASLPAQGSSSGRPGRIYSCMLRTIQGYVPAPIISDVVHSDFLSYPL
jgi:hypothetical protein